MEGEKKLSSLNVVSDRTDRCCSAFELRMNDRFPDPKTNDKDGAETKFYSKHGSEDLRNFTSKPLTHSF